MLEHPGPGLSGARNSGITYGSNPVVCFIDDDAVPLPGWSVAVREAFSEPEVAAVGGRVRPRFTGTDGGIVPRPRWVPESCDWVFGCDYAGGPSDGALIRNPIGAAMAVRREILDEGEGFRSGVGRLGADCAGGEETELFQRLTAGHPERQVRKKDAFRVLHSVPPSRVCLRYVLRRSFMEGRSKAALSALSYTALGAERDHLDRAATGVGGELRRLVHGDLSAVLRLATGAGVILAAGTGFLIGRRIPDVVSTGDAAVPETGGGTGRPEVSVVLCTDGRGRRLGDALAAVAAAGRVAASRCPVEILLVDNSGSGDCAEIPEVKEILAEGAPVRVVRAPVRGLSRARNVGLRAARGRMIAFTDDDALAEPDWILEAVDVLERTGADCVTGRVLPASVQLRSHRVFESTGGFDKGGEPRIWTRSGVSVGEVPPVYPYPAGCFGSGNNMVFTRRCIDTVGGFDEELGAGSPVRGGEDLDMFRRIILSGGTIAYAPTMVVKHHHRSGMRDLGRQMYGYGTGMAASLARCAFDDRRYARDIVTGVPAGVRVLLSSRKGGAPGSAARYPRYLTAVELVGYLTGAPLLLATMFRNSRTAMGAGA